MTNPNPLSAELRRLRTAAGLSGAAAARRTGISQSKVSRAETGKFLLTEEEVTALCRLYRTPAAERRRLVEMTRQLVESKTSARAVLQRGTWWMQERIGKLEAAAQRLRYFCPAAIVGLAQSAAYIAALYGDTLPEDELARAVQARLERQRILDTDRQFTMLMAEGALRWNMGGADVMIDQLGHLTEISRRPNVRVGIIAQETPTTVPALHTYTIYDSTAVLIGTWTATAIITDTRSVHDYEDYWSELAPFASWDEDARTIIARVSGDYRQST